MMKKRQHWFLEDDYPWADQHGGVTREPFHKLYGPNGPALVDVYLEHNGKCSTQPGWGRDDFMANYDKLMFRTAFAQRRLDRKQVPYALVMRSARMVCIDIDGKNKGFDGAYALGFLPRTIAETSKSGNGYHLFYTVPDTWNQQLGFAGFRDSINFEQGVDVRGEGCVYHFHTQRWNDVREVAELPEHLIKRLTERQERHIVAKKIQEDTIANGTEEERLGMQGSIQTRFQRELKKGVPQGNRNNWLYQMDQSFRTANIPDRKKTITEAGEKIGLDDREIARIVNR